jgi:hypothetical protein
MAEIKNSDITTGELEGDGSFDVFMRSVNRHLLEEYSKNRIKGTDYSNVYLGAMQAVLAQAMQFQLQKQAADKQADLVDKQIDMIDVQIIGELKNNELKDKQMLKMDQEILVLEQQVLKSKQDVLVAEQQVLVMKQQVLKSAAEVINLGHQGNVLIQTVGKVEAEKFLLTEKKWSEQAQRLDVVNNQPVAGVIKTQKELYIKQMDGFDRKAEQTAAKMMIDTWNVRRTTNDIYKEPSSCSADNLDIVVKKLVSAAGLGTINTIENPPQVEE